MSYQFTPDLFTEIAVPEKGILSHTLYNDDSVKIILFGFAPGQELTAHTAPMPATIMILEGEGALTLGADTKDVHRGALAHMSPGLTHAVSARTPLRMLLYLHKRAATSA
jgi:quercetin dioxygenase-like cupin family protein